MVPNWAPSPLIKPTTPLRFYRHRYFPASLTNQLVFTGRDEAERSQAPAFTHAEGTWTGERIFPHFHSGGFAAGSRPFVGQKPDHILAGP